MQINQFLDDPEIRTVVERALKLKETKKRFSDIEDGNGNQYVDLVQEGGGVLGIALIGYTYVLEKAGIRFFNLAGASAGAINTMLIASIKDISTEKSEKILSALSAQNLFDFVDGGKGIKNIISKYVDNKSMFGSLVWNIFNLKNKLIKKLGINPGLTYFKRFGKKDG